MDDAVVALGGTACLDVIGMLEIHLDGRVTDVGACRVHIELGRFLRILARYRDILGPFSYIERLLEGEVVLLSVDCDGALATDIDDAELTVVEEVTSVRPFGGIDIERSDGGELQRCRRRLSAPDEEPVEHRVGPVDLTRCKDLLDKKLAPHTLGVVVLGIHRVAGVTHIIVGVAVLSLHLITFPAALCGGCGGSKHHCHR